MFVIPFEPCFGLLGGFLLAHTLLNPRVIFCGWFCLLEEMGKGLVCCLGKRERFWFPPVFGFQSPRLFGVFFCGGRPLPLAVSKTHRAQLSPTAHNYIPAWSFPVNGGNSFLTCTCSNNFVPYVTISSVSTYRYIHRWHLSNKQHSYIFTIKSSNCCDDPCL